MQQSVCLTHAAETWTRRECSKKKFNKNYLSEVLQNIKITATEASVHKNNVKWSAPNSGYKNNVKWSAPNRNIKRDFIGHTEAFIHSHRQAQFAWLNVHNVFVVK
jgi:hypothetical protein